MTALRLVVTAMLLAAAPVHAQSPGEIAYWESVRDSKDPAELRAYLEQYPSGTFAALARRRLSTLENQPAAAPKQASPAPPPVAASPPPASNSLVPIAGDAWTYRLSYPRLRGQWGQPTRAPQTHVVRAGSVADGRVVDLLSVDGGTPIQVEHSRGSYLLPEGVSIFSPYLLALGGPGTSGRLGSIAIRDTPCQGQQYNCTASGRVVGQERITLPAGQFVATKVVVEQEWSPVVISGLQTGRLLGGRTLTVWYVPELRRAVKYSSRQTVGDLPPIDPTFDLELVSYNLK